MTASPACRVEVRVDAGSRLRVRPVEPPGPEVFVGPGGRRGAADEVVVLVPVRRGVHDSVTLDIASAAPFALQWWTRRVQLPLPVGAPRLAPLRPGAAAAPTAPTKGRATSLERPRPDEGLPRGARPYVPGDGRRLVHWRSTAHAGKLMVRELERPAAEPVTITVELPADPDAAERVAEGALGTVVAPARRGRAGPPRHPGTGGPGPRRRGGPARRGAPPRPGRAPGPPHRRLTVERRAVSIVEAVRRANQPGPPEDSVRLRVACLGAVLVAIAACASLDEIAWTTAHRRHGARVGRHGLLPRHPGPAPRVGEGPGGRRRHRRLRLVLPLR